MTASTAVEAAVQTLPAREASSRRKLALFALLFFVLAGVSSVQRFGQRENEYAKATSDSDFYIDMAHVFLGDAPAFNGAHVEQAPHHYNRPLFAWMAGYLGRYLLHDNFRTAFSLIDLAGATLIAFVLFLWMRQALPGERFLWLPSVLFVTAFPQMDWGYHILSDTLGFATAFASAFYAAWLIRKTDENGSLKPALWMLHLAATAALASVAFLARETEWFAIITAGFLVAAWPASAQVRAKRGLVVATMLLGEIPRLLYARHFGLGGMPVWANAHMLVSPAYLMDWFVKTGVAFNFCWIAALGGVLAMRRRRDWDVPPWIVGWSIAGVLYMGAGYRVNSMDVSGYPLRLSFGVFPLVYWLVWRCFVEWVKPARASMAVIAFCVVEFLTNALGVAMDSAKGKITVIDLLHGGMHYLGR